MRGVGCFMAMCAYALDDVFPSPCGVWVVSINARARERYYQFPSPCGVWVVSLMPELVNSAAEFPSPCGVWVVSALKMVGRKTKSFRPLAGCGSFLFYKRFGFD